MSLKKSQKSDTVLLSRIWWQSFPKYVFLDNDGVEIKQNSNLLAFWGSQGYLIYWGPEDTKGNGRSGCTRGIEVTLVLGVPG